MKNYFTPVDFGVVIEQPKIEVIEPDIDIKQQLKAIKDELNLIGQGQSELMPQGVHFGGKIHPHRKALETMELKPSKETIRNFILLVKEDTNRRVAQEFAKLFKDVYPELEGLL